MKIEKITEAALRTLLGEASPKVGSIIPSPESFRVGDIILHRDPRVAFGKTNLVSSFQRMRGHSVMDASWSHVSMYVGDGMIAESMPSVGLYLKRSSGLGVDFLVK